MRRGERLRNVKRVALAVAAVLVGVSGCGRGHGPLLRSPLPTPPSRPKRGGSTLVLGAWTMVDLGSDGRTIRVADATGDCLDFDHTDVKESTVDVHVTVWNRRWASGRNEDCTLELRGGPYTIELP